MTPRPKSPKGVKAIDVLAVVRGGEIVWVFMSENDAGGCLNKRERLVPATVTLKPKPSRRGRK